MAEHCRASGIAIPGADATERRPSNPEAASKSLRHLSDSVLNAETGCRVVCLPHRERDSGRDDSRFDAIRKTSRPALVSSNAGAFFVRQVAEQGAPLSPHLQKT